MVLGSLLENAVIMYDVGLLHQPARRPGRRPNSAESKYTCSVSNTSVAALTKYVGSCPHTPLYSEWYVYLDSASSFAIAWVRTEIISNHRASLPAQSKAQVDLGVNSTAFSLKLYWRHGRDCLRGHRVHTRSAGRK